VSRILIWCAGDISRYELVNYVIDGRTFRSFLSPAALYEYVRPRYLMVFIPEILFDKEHDKMYKILVKAKAGFVDNGVRYRLFVDNKEYTISEQIHMDDFIKDLEDPSKTTLVKIPHPGKASALSLLCMQVTGSEILYFIRHVNVSGSGNFNSIVNVMFHNIVSIVKKHEINEINVDLTHGTNIVVQALMLSVSMVKSLFENIRVNLWIAPIVPVSGRKEVYFENISEILDTVNTIVSISTATKLLDERPLENILTLFKSTGEKLGPMLRRTFGLTKTALEKYRNVLWAFRSGQLITLPRYIKSLSDEWSNINREVKKFIEEYLNNELWRVLNENDKPLLPIIEYVALNLEEILHNLSSDNPLKIVIRSIEEAYAKGHYIQVLLIIRELIILLILLWLSYRSVKIYDKYWQDIDNILKNSSDRKLSKGERYQKLIEEFPDLAKLDPSLIDKVMSYFDKIIEYRNKFAHGFLIRDSVVDPCSVEQWIVKDRPLEKIEKEDLEKLAKEGVEIVLKLLEEIRKKYCINNVR